MAIFGHFWPFSSRKWLPWPDNLSLTTGGLAVFVVSFGNHKNIQARTDTHEDSNSEKCTKVHFSVFGPFLYFSTEKYKNCTGPKSTCAQHIDMGIGPRDMRKMPILAVFCENS